MSRFGLNNFTLNQEEAKKVAQRAIDKGKEAAKSTLEKVKSNKNVQEISEQVKKVLEDSTDFLKPILEKVSEIPELVKANNLKVKFTKAITALRKKEAFNQLFDDEINASDKDEIRKTQLLALRNILAQNINVFTYNDYRNNRFFNYKYILLILKNRLAVLEDIKGSIQDKEDKEDEEGRLDRLLKALKMDNTLKEYILGNTTTEPKPTALGNKITPLILADSFFHGLNDILINFTEPNGESKEAGGLQTIIKLFEDLTVHETKEVIKTKIQKSVDELNEKDMPRVMELIKEITEKNSTNNNITPGGTRRNKTNQKKRKSSKRKIHK